MNGVLRAFAEKTLLDGLARLEPKNRRTFALMYGRDGGKRTVADAEQMSMEDVIKEIPDNHIDWAMHQVQNTLKQVT